MAKSTVIHTFDYVGETIHLFPDGQFGVLDEDDGDYRATYETLAKAKEAIDRRLKTRERTKREKLDIPVYVKLEIGRYGQQRTEKFVERLLVGVHAGLGTLLLDPPLSKDDRATVYVRNENVQTLLKQQTDMENELESVREKLNELTLSDRYTYHSRIDETKHAQIIAEIKRKCSVA